MAAIAILVGAVPAVASGTASGAEDDAVRQLAERYAPVVEVRRQTVDCDTDTESWAPAAVEVVLGNAEIVLRSSDGTVIVEGPTAADLFAAGPDDYLDFPGDSTRPGCDYERDFERFNGDRPPVVYAHLAREEDQPGRLALQFWTYWYFNDWNNTHESDWEGIQLVFDADTAEEALTQQPVEVGYAQHEGGVRRAWDDTDRSADHPVVFASAGSHASYLEAQLFLGRGASEGFGCDNTTAPSDRIDPDVVVLPDEVDDAEDPRAWLAFEGRWGQRERGPWNGPTGPADKDRWSRPLTWQDALRDSSVTVPGRGVFGDSATGAFCFVAEAGSTAVLVVLREPWLALGGLVALALLLAVIVRLARPTLRAARSRYRARRRTYAAVGLAFVPLGFLAAGFHAVLVRLPGVGPAADLVGSRGPAAFTLALATGATVSVLATSTVQAVVALVLQAEDDGRPIGALDAYRQALRRWREIGSATLQLVAVVAALSITVIGIPWAIRQAVRWSFLGAAVADRGVGGRAALRASGDTVDGRWWRSTAVLAVTTGLALATGPVVGIVLLMVTDLPLGLVNVIAGIVYVLTVPVAAIATTLWWRQGGGPTEGGDALSEDAAVPVPG